MNKGEQERAFMFCLSRRIHSIIHPLLFTGIGTGFADFWPNSNLTEKKNKSEEMFVTKSSKSIGNYNLLDTLKVFVIRKVFP